MRTFAMGDIHGAAKALEQCLERSGFDKQNDRLIQLGDVADGWSETSECVDVLLSIDNLVSLRGNHDVWVYDWMMFGLKPMLWTQQGGQATIDSYIKSGKLLDKHHKSFWLNQEDWYVDDQDRLFIHAGWDYFAFNEELHSGTTRRELFERQANLSVNAGSIAKECHWDRSIYKGALSAFLGGRSTTGKFGAIEIFNEVFIGHTSHKNPHPLHLGNLWNMDTGAGWDGRLSIMDVDTKEYWTSDLSKDLYPDEKGR